MSDKINHPSHYTQGSIEVWDFIIDQKMDYLRGNAIKYICRAPFKENYVEDIKKAIAYLNKAIAVAERSPDEVQKRIELDAQAYLKFDSKEGWLQHPGQGEFKSMTGEKDETTK